MIPLFIQCKIQAEPSHQIALTLCSKPNDNKMLRTTKRSVSQTNDTQYFCPKIHDNSSAYPVPADISGKAIFEIELEQAQSRDFFGAFTLGAALYGHGLRMIHERSVVAGSARDGS